MAELAAAIHAAPERGVLVATGGGSGIFSRLLCEPGASATVLEALVPYSEQSIAEYLSFRPRQSCSARTARALAMRAFTRALALGGSFGFAVTAALATSRARRGEHRAHFGFQSASVTRSWTLELAKGALSRREEEERVTAFGLGALAFSLGVENAPEVRGEVATAWTKEEEMAELMRGDRAHVAARTFGAVLPGAFNPLHGGHRAMRVDAARRLGVAVGFEICIANVDKPPLDYVDLNARLAQFDPAEVVVTNTPTFLAKARALGEPAEKVAFVVGVDTLQRIAEPRYYGGTQARDAALAEMGDRACSFLVYGRVVDGVFKTLADVSLPEGLRALCEGVPESGFRHDISSTALRRGR